MFRKKWYENIVESRYNTRDKMYTHFEKSVLHGKLDGYNKEEMRMIFIGHANVSKEGICNLPLQLMWLDKYWDEIE